MFLWSVTLLCHAITDTRRRVLDARSRASETLRPDDDRRHPLSERGLDGALFHHFPTKEAIATLCSSTRSRPFTRGSGAGGRKPRSLRAAVRGVIAHSCAGSSNTPTSPASSTCEAISTRSRPGLGGRGAQSPHRGRHPRMDGPADREERDSPEIDAGDLRDRHRARARDRAEVARGTADSKPRPSSTSWRTRPRQGSAAARPGRVDEAPPPDRGRLALELIADDGQSWPKPGTATARTNQ